MHPLFVGDGTPKGNMYFRYFLCGKKRLLAFICIVLAAIGMLHILLQRGYVNPLDIDWASVPRRSTTGRPLVLWANDFHISPIHDLKSVLRPLNVTIVDLALSSRCHITNTCQKTLKVINSDNGIKLSDPNLIPQFYDAYKDDAVMKRVDAFVCFHPSAMCELFMPFHKPLLVIASIRYELGRFEPDRWKKWNENLIKISRDPRSLVGANNLYDLEYIRYFTGIKGVLLPSFCGYTHVSYQPEERYPYILAIVRSGNPAFQNTFLENWDNGLKKLKSNLKLKPLRSVYSHYEYTDLIKHPGIVYIPYQVSTMSLFEHYRMNIPLFFPSFELLAKWQLEHMVMSERTWYGAIHGKKANASTIPGVMDIPDPNNDSDLEAIKYWIKYADFYQWPHITYYESAQDLIIKIQKANLKDISEKMKLFNKKAKDELVVKWNTILNRIEGGHKSAGKIGI